MSPEMNRVQTRSVERPSLPRRERGQTEPLAALVAVALFCLALSVYAVFVTGFVPDLGSDRELAEATGERIWEAISEDGIYPADADLRAQLDSGDLPRGHQVAANVTYVDDRGYVTETSHAQFAETGSITGTTGLPAGETFQRPIPVQHREGDIRPGMLTVVVSDGE